MTEEKLKAIITKQDLSLMMESYKNMIEANLAINEKQDVIYNKLGQMCTSLNTILVEFKDAFKEVHIHHKDCAKSQLLYNDNLKEMFRKDKEDRQKEYSGQNLKIFGLIGMLCTVILGLIGLVYKLWPITSG
jgi:hypothetical protein